MSGEGQEEAGRIARALEWLLRSGWSSGLMPEPELSLERIRDAALRAEGQGGFGGDVEWQAPMGVLLGSLYEEAELSPLGRTMAYGQLVKLLRERLRAGALWRREPEILERAVAAPVVVLGQMRSGTTRLQRLLACDERFAHSRFFEMMSPVPKPGRYDGRMFRAAAGLRLLNALNPALARIHPTSAKAVEEEFGLFSFSVYGAQFEAQWRVPSFARWWEEADKAPVYCNFRKLLQTIGWSRGEDEGKPWLLKAPQFMEDLSPFLAEFPDTRLLCLSRDPVAVVGSSASLVWNQMRVQTAAADKQWIGREWLRKTERRAQISVAVRAANPQVPQLEIGYEAMDRDWRGEVRRIYDFLGYELLPEVEARMERYVAKAAAGRHHGHRYSLEEFGLNPAEVRSRLAASALPPLP